MRTLIDRLGLELLCALALILVGAGSLTYAFVVPVAVPSEQGEELNPNDCSRGVDEANQEACDAIGGAQ